jgi:hypothetical protein
VLDGITSWFAARVLDTPRWKFLAAIFGVMLLKTGITVATGPTLVMAVDPFTNHYKPWEQYQFWTWLGPFLAHQIGATTALTYTLFYLAFSILFTVLVVRWLFRALDENVARVAVLVFVLLPISALPYYWVFTDSFTLFLMAAALYVPRSRLGQLVIGIALGMQHFELASIAMAATLFALAWTARRGGRLAYDWRWAATLLVGAIAGKVVLLLVFSHLGIDVNSGRLWYVLKLWLQMMRRFAYSWHFIVFSMFAVGWLVVIPFIKRKSPESEPFGVAALGLILLLPISQDPTRIYAIVTFPLVAVFILRNSEFLARIGREMIGLLVVLWLLVPWMFVWQGKPLVTALPYDLYEAAYRLGFPDDGDAPRKGPRDPRWFE